MKHTGFITSVVVCALAVTGVTVQADARSQDRPQQMSFETLDTDGDGQITKEEMQARGQARFDAADSNGDGLLSQDELNAAATARAQDRVSGMIERFDTDGDGALSRDEMPRPKRGERMFDRIDADNSGGISEEEFAEAQKRHKARRGKNADKN